VHVGMQNIKSSSQNILNQAVHIAVSLSNYQFPVPKVQYWYR